MCVTVITFHHFYLLFELFYLILFYSSLLCPILFYLTLLYSNLFIITGYWWTGSRSSGEVCWQYPKGICCFIQYHYFLYIMLYFLRLQTQRIVPRRSGKIQRMFFPDVKNVLPWYKECSFLSFLFMFSFYIFMNSFPLVFVHFIYSFNNLFSYFFPLSFYLSPYCFLPILWFKFLTYIFDIVSIYIMLIIPLFLFFSRCSSMWVCTCTPTCQKWRQINRFQLYLQLYLIWKMPQIKFKASQW